MGIVNRDGALWMATGIDNSGLEQDAAEAESIIDGIGTRTEKAGSRMQKSFQSMENTIASAKETMSVLEKTISTLNSKIDSNTTSSSADTKKIKELESALADLKSKYDNLNKSVPQSGTQIKQSAQDAKQAASDYNSLVKSINTAWKTLGIGVSLAGIKSLTSEIVNVRGEIQMLESSFEVLLGGKGISGFMSEMKQFAVDSPLSMNGVANAAQTLLGFGITAEKVMPTIKQIGDISMGNEERFKSLSLAFAQMSATGKLMGQDLLQMINAGFNPLQTISEKTGKSIGELKKDMENGAISSEMVAQAFASATEKGGKFYGMTQKQAEGIRGLQAQLEGGLQEAFNEIGKSQEGLITGGYRLTTMLVENYNKVGKVLVGLIATYGVYRTALILNIIATQSLATTQFQLGVVLARVQKIWQGLTATMSVNPYVLIATAITGLIVTVWALNDATTAQESAQSKLNSIVDETKTKKEELRGKSNELISVINSETKSVKEQILAYKELQKEHQKYLGNKSFEDFKKLSPKEQQQLIDKSSFELSDTIINESLTKYKRLQDALNNRSGGFKGINEGVDLLKEISKELGIEGASSEYIRKTLSETITLLEKQKEVRDEAGKEAEKGPKAIQDQIFSTKKSVLDLKKELEDLQKGIIPAASKDDAGFDFAKTIEEKTKSLKDAENKLNLLLHGKSTSEIEKGNKTGESAAEKALKLAQKKADDQLKLNNDKARADLDARNIELDNQQSLLNIQEEGFDKQQKQTDLNHQKEILAIDKRVQELIEKKQDAERKEWDIKNPNGSKTPFAPKTKSVADLNYSDITGIIESDIIATKTREKAISDSLKATIEEYQSYADKYAGINTRFNKKIADLEKARTPENKEQVDRSITEAKYEQGEALKAVNNEFAQREETFLSWTNQIADLSLKQLQNLLSQVEKELKAAESSGVSGADLAVARAKVDAAKEQIKNANTSTTPGKRTIKEWQDLEKTLQDVNDSFEEIGDSVGGTVGVILSAAGQIASSTLSMINGIITLANSASTATEQTAKAASASIQAVEKASVILAIISAALQIATKIASLFAADYSEYNKAKEAYESYISVLDKVIEKQKELVETMTGENARNSYEYALELIKKQEAAARELGKQRLDSGASAGSHSIGVRIRKRMSQEGWNQASQVLGKDFGWATDGRMTGLFDLSIEQLKELQEKAPSFWAQLDGDVQNYLNSIIESEKAIEDMRKVLQESITQVSFDSFRDSFLDTLLDMNSDAKDFAEDFEKYLQKSMLNSLLKEKFDEQIRALYNSFSKYGEDNINEAEYAALQKQKDDLVNDMIKERDKMKDLFDWTSDSDTSQSSSRGGFETITQDQAGSIDGRLTGMHETDLRVEQNTLQLILLASERNSVLKGYTEWFQAIRNVLVESMFLLQEIRDSNNELYDIREDIAYLRKNGIKIA